MSGRGQVMLKITLTVTDTRPPMFDRLQRRNNSHSVFSIFFQHLRLFLLIKRCRHHQFMRKLYIQVCKYLLTAGREYCQFDAFNASCAASPGHVILVETAYYGRLALGHCVTHLGH